MSDLDLSLDDCLDLLGAGRNHKAWLELEALWTAYATVQAERDAARADVQRLIEQNDETTREWGEDVTRLRAELATLRETLVGEVGTLKRGPEYTDGVCHSCGLYSSYCPCGYIDDALDRAITIIKGTP